jgi:hypothetical protein
MRNMIADADVLRVPVRKLRSLLGVGPLAAAPASLPAVQKSASAELRQSMRRPGVRLAALAMVTVLALAGCILATMQPAAAYHGGGYNVLGCRTIALQSKANMRFVSAESGEPYTEAWDGMLRARNLYTGPWEKFALCQVDDPAFPDSVAIWAFSKNGWVSVENNYPEDTWAMLRGRPNTSTVQTWEEFRILHPCNDCIALFSAANHNLVSAEVGYPRNDIRYGMLRARTNISGPWEEFYLYYL